MWLLRGVNEGMRIARLGAGAVVKSWEGEVGRKVRWRCLLPAIR